MEKLENLSTLLSRLPRRHRTALEWFHDRAGTVEPWPAPLVIDGEETLLGNRPKGIYKPEWSTYALSFKQMLKTRYRTQDPRIRPDGTWIYEYYQEGLDPLKRDAEFTNIGLMNCMRDKVPVGVMIQTALKPRPRYKIMGIALVSGWDDGFFFFEGFAPSGIARSPGPAAELEMLREQPGGDVPTFDPSTVIDARKRTLTEITKRQGQPAFRQALVDAYRGRCAITGFDALPALEAAHITPYKGPATNVVQNGLLLRADLHTLFDLGLLAIDAETMTVIISTDLGATAYSELHGRPLDLPRDPSLHPSREALTSRREWTRL